MAFFRMFHIMKLFRRSITKFHIISEAPMWIEQMKSCLKLSKNCSIHGNNCQISGLYNFWKSIKSNVPDVWNWHVWTLFGLDIEVGGGGGPPHGPPAPLAINIWQLWRKKMPQINIISHLSSRMSLKNFLKKSC